MLIAFCGTDGCGKSTYIDYFKRYFEEKGVSYKTIDPMKKGEFANALKKIPYESNKNINEYLDPTLISAAYALDMLYFMSSQNNNNILLSHRYDLCCRTYAMLNRANMDYVELILSYLPVPDLTVYIKISPEVAYQRLLHRDQKLSWKENLDIITSASLCYDTNFHNICGNKIMVDNTESNNFEENINVIKKAMCELNIEHINKNTNWDHR